MQRRNLLRIGAVGLAGLAGCLDTGGDETAPGDGGNATSGDDTDAADSSPKNDGWPPEHDTPPEERTVDTSSFERLTVDGVEVPLVPIDVAHYWYQRQEARYADARGAGQYESLHITGAAHSPAMGRGSDDHVAEWPTEDRVVCYCGCPHHLSTMRAADLLSNGHEEVYAIDEGFVPWVRNGYPVTGEDEDEYQLVGTIVGEAPGAGEGSYAWARHVPSEQYEAAPIDAEGNYELHLRFDEVDEQSTIRVETPSYEIEKPLGELVDGVVTGP